MYDQLKMLELVAATLLPLAHMNMVIPTPRNAMDGDLDEFRGGKAPHGYTSCTCANAEECDMGVRKEGGGGPPPPAGYTWADN